MDKAARPTTYLGHGLLSDPDFVEAFLGRKLHRENGEKWESLDGFEQRIVTKRELISIPEIYKNPQIRDDFKLLGLVPIRRAMRTEYEEGPWVRVLRINLDPEELEMIRTLNFDDAIFRETEVWEISHPTVSVLKDPELGKRVDGLAYAPDLLGIPRAEMSRLGDVMRKEIRTRLGLPVTSVEGHHSRGIEK